MLTGVALRILVALQGIGRADSEGGQTLAEYGLIMAVVAVSVIVLALAVMRDSVVSAFESVVPCLGGSC